MALPSMPAVVPRRLEVKPQQALKKLKTVEPRLKDKGRLQTGPKFSALELGQRQAMPAQIDAKLETRRAATLVALPPLEEVGRRRVSNLPQALALEEKRQEAVALQGLQAMEPRISPIRAVAAMDALQDAAQAPETGRSRFAEKIAAILPAADTELRAAPQAAFVAKPAIAEAAVGPQRSAQAIMEGAKKGVEIEGPLSNRKVLAYDVPQFPAWARDQGVLEASVSIRFVVDKMGGVLPSLRVERTSGYGRLDRLAMDALKNWKFEPLSMEENQWGVITFRFVLE